MAKTKTKGIVHSDTSKLKGFFRVQITEDGENGPKVVGDSGWKENLITNLGVQEYLVKHLLGSADLAISYMALGSGGAPIATDTTLAGENFHKSTNATTNSRAVVSTSIVSSRTAQFTAAFSSANSFVTASVNISNIGLFNSYLTSLANNGTLFAGNTYSSSSLATNQNVNATYQIQFP